MAKREWTAMDEEAANQGSAIGQIRQYIGSVKRTNKRPPRQIVATVHARDLWGNRGKSLAT